MTGNEIAAIILCAILLVPGAFLGYAVYKVIKHFLDTRARTASRRSRPRR